MREILFRGKRTHNDEWIVGSLHIEKFTDDEEYLCCEISSCDVYLETVGQYTGLTDKNGTKIFEGDLLESQFSENKEDWKVWKVVFENGSFVFDSVKKSIKSRRKYKHEQNLLCVEEINFYGLVKIGNIHDNPELLKGGARQ